MHVMVVPLAAEVSVAEAVRRLAHRDRVTAWSGAWSRGGLVTCDPVSVPWEFPQVPDVQPGPPDAVGGGWFGYLPFDGPGSWAWYRDVLRHDGARWWYEALVDEAFPEAAAAARARTLAAELARPATPARARLEITGVPDGVAHVVAVERCVQAIRRGEVYQANIATSIDGVLRGGVHTAWAQLVEGLAPARAGLVADPELAAVGASPELFVSRTGRSVRSSPIKGTRPRTGGAADPVERARLAASTKDAAENVMIVDLVRNDLARVCPQVTVPALLDVQAHPGVWHLVSTVAGELAPDADDAALLAATFPPGSVTGAPKLRAVQLIAELEERPRGLFTGAMGYVGPLAGLELAVTIRTLEVAPDGRTRLDVGGGVTVDSTPFEEWAECLTKAAPLLAALDAAPLHTGPVGGRADPALGVFETMLVRDGHIVAFAEHVARLHAALVECYGPAPADLAGDLTRAVDAAVAGRDGAWRVRVDATPDGLLGATAVPWPPGPPVDEQPGVVLWPYRLDDRGGERHKFVDRAWLERIEADGAPPAAADSAVLLVDGADQVLETTRCSVFAVRDGRAVTPPLDGRILPGTGRRAVLDTLGDNGVPGRLTLADLAAAEGVFVVNAVRGVQWVREIAGVARWTAPDTLTVAVAREWDARTARRPPAHR